MRNIVYNKDFFSKKDCSHLMVRILDKLRADYKITKKIKEEILSNPVINLNFMMQKM